MKRTFQVLNRMVQAGVIGRYAVGGAVAAFNYVEASLTFDLDILVSVEKLATRPGSALVTLEPVFAYLREVGYGEVRNEGVIIEGWPVQFLPVAADLDAEGLERAVDVDVEISADEPPITIRVLRAEHVVATALKLGRPKDRIRISQFLAEEAVDLAALRDLLDRHGLRGEWSRFCAQAGIPDFDDVRSGS